MQQEPTPSYDAIAQARNHPGSWIYELDGNFGPDDAVPPEAIVGAWWVDHSGRITGSFIRNHNYSKFSKGAGDSDTTIQFPWNT